jgi:nucleotide-binding universal stress UspA family protein
MLLVIAYDDSPDARLALEAAGRLFPGARAIVVHAWGVPAAPVAVAGTGAPVLPAGHPEDPGLERHARAIADDAADRATRAGLEAQPAVCRADHTREIAYAVLAIAAERSADAVVVGRRGLGRIPTVILGSVSETLVREAPLTVVVVPHDE